MLKRYYSIAEAAEFLSEQSKTAFRERDVMELASREEIRLCFWADVHLRVSSSPAYFDDEDWSHYFYMFRGYLQIPTWQISPHAEAFEVESVEDIVETVRARGRWDSSRCTDPVPPLSDQAPPHSAYAVRLSRIASIIHRRNKPFEHSVNVFNLTMQDVFVPAIDLLKLNAGAGYVGGGAGAKWPNHETQKLTALRMAAVKFWANYDPSDPSTARTNEDVSEWLQTEYKKVISSTLADAMATILRPDGLKMGPRKKS